MSSKSPAKPDLENRFQITMTFRDVAGDMIIAGGRRTASQGIPLFGQNHAGPGPGGMNGRHQARRPASYTQNIRINTVPIHQIPPSSNFFFTSHGHARSLFLLHPARFNLSPCSSQYFDTSFSRRSPLSGRAGLKGEENDIFY
jgi:hypothetical protein